MNCVASIEEERLNQLLRDEIEQTKVKVEEHESKSAQHQKLTLMTKFKDMEEKYESMKRKLEEMQASDNTVEKRAKRVRVTASDKDKVTASKVVDNMSKLSV